MNTIPNPFPMLGTNSDISPVGYKKELEKIRRVVSSNIGNQPLIVNIYGEYGQGKTTILKYLKEKFSGEWGNLSVFDDIDISKFPNLEKDLVSCQNKHESEGTDGVFLILDEMQHVDPGNNKLSDEQKTFLNVLRRFADNTIENVDNQKFVLCIAMHPGTKKFLKDYGHIDVEQRIDTLNVDLHDIDYYMAFKLVEEHFKKLKYDFNDYFDESFIYAIYILLPHLENLRTGMSGRFNGRTFSQVFFNLFEYLRNLNRKLEFQDLKNILLGKYNVKLGSLNIVLPYPDKYYDIYNKLEDSEKYIFDKFLFNPKWHFKKEFEKIDEFFINKLIEKQLVSKRKCAVFDRDDFDVLDNELRNALTSLPSERIYLNGEKIIFFVDTADDEIKDKLLNKTKLYDVYRLNDEHLKSIYNYHPQGGDSDKIIDYYQKDPTDKVNYFYSLIEKSQINFSKIKLNSCQLGIHYQYLNAIYNLMDDIQHKIAIFYYTKDYASVDFDKYFNDVVKELESSDYDFALFFVCPYYMEDLPKDRIILRKMENRVFINNLSREKLLELIKGNYFVADEIIKESSRLFTQESVEKGFTMPLTGFMEKINNKPSLFKEKFLNDIKKSWKIETSGNTDEDNLELSEILKSGVDGNGNLINLARESLSEFMDLEYGSIKGAKFSKYEENILELFGSKEITKKEFETSKKKYFSYYSRFDIEDYVMNILESKSILEIKRDGTKPIIYKIIEPVDIVKDIISTLNDIDIHELIKKDQDFYLKRNIGDLKLLLSDKNLYTLDNYKKGRYNSELNRINKSLKKINNQDSDLIENIKKEYDSIKEKLDYDINGIKLKDININYYFKELKSESDSRVYDNSIELEKLQLDNINLYLSQIIQSETYEIDKEMLFSLEGIIRHIKNWNLDKESNEKLETLNEKIMNIDTAKNDLKILNLEELINQQNAEFSLTKLEPIYQVLSDINYKILNKLLSVSENINSKLNELNNIKDNLKNYKVLFSELNEFNRKDMYLDKIRTVPLNDIDMEIENSYIENIICNNLNIVTQYLDFILENSKKGELENVEQIENTILQNENMNIKDYLTFVRDFEEVSYLNHYLSKYFNANTFDETELIRIISQIKSSEESLKNIEDKKIVNDILLPKGLLKRIILIEEYFEDGKEIKNQDINYQVKGD